MGAPLLSRIVRKLTKTITLSNVANGGAIGTVPVASVGGTNGMVWVEALAIQCTTTLTGTSATLTLGTVGNAGGILSTTTATGLTAGLLWSNTSPGTGVASMLGPYMLNANLSITVAVANVTAGVLEFDFYWLPFSPNGVLF